MLEIKVFNSPLADSPIETYTTDLSLHQWMRANVPSYDGTAKVLALRERMLLTDWRRVTDGTVELKVVPQGGDFNPILFLVNPALALTSAALGALIPGLPTTSNRKARDLDTAEARANTPKLNQSIPEMAGRFKRFPDYLLPPRRKFANEREQSLNLFLCVGIGEFQISSSSVKVGETSLSALGADAEFTIYEPGEDVSADPAAEWWHSASEVGGTSTLASGLDLKSTFEVTETVEASEYAFDEFSIIIPSAAGEFPADWFVGLDIRIEQYLNYVVTGGNTITGWLDQLVPYIGMPIEIAGPNEGLYFVESYSSTGEMTLMFADSTPVTGLTNGVLRMAIGIAGMVYRTVTVTDSEITVDRLDENGDVDATWLGFDVTTTNDAVIELADDGILGDWTGPFSACPSGEVTDRFEVDIFYPQGLIRFNDEGKARKVTVTYEAQWRDAETGGAWSSQTYTRTAADADQAGFTHEIMLGGTFRPEVRMRRTTAESTSTRVNDKIQWYALRSKLNAPTSYEDVTTLSVKLRSSDRLGAQSENQVNLIATRILPTRVDGEWEAPAPTRNIVDFAAYVAKSIGYTDDQLDLVEMDRLNDIWIDRGDYYDWVHDESTVKDVLDQTFRAGFAELTVEGGKIRPVRDEPRSAFEQMYTPQNMTSSFTRSLAAIRPDDPDGVDVEFTNKDTWTKETVECRLAGDLGLKTEKIKLDGVVDIDRAWRIGMRRRREIKYRRWQYNFATEMDALNSRYLSYVALADDVPGYGKSCILQGVEDTSDGVLLLVSEQLEWDSSENHIVAIRNEDGTLNGPYAATRGDSDYEIYADVDPLPVIISGQEPPHVLFGTESRWTFPSLLTSISPSSISNVNVSATNYDDRVYDDDDGFAPS